MLHFFHHCVRDRTQITNLLIFAHKGLVTMTSRVSWKLDVTHPQYDTRITIELCSGVSLNAKHTWPCYDLCLYKNLQIVHTVESNA